MSAFRDISFGCIRQPSGIAAAEIAKAEAALRCRFPGDYSAFVVRFGAGEFRDIALRVLSPAAIVAATPGDQARLREHWFWPHSEDVLPKARALETVACFDGCCGDDVRFHPADPSTMFVLPHASEVVLRAQGFRELVAVFRSLYNVESKALTYDPCG
jgi:hypothetical protein